MLIKSEEIVKRAKKEIKYLEKEKKETLKYVSEVCNNPETSRRNTTG
ncbi:hypothetical protein [Methanobrevibacter intestini]